MPSIISIKEFQITTKNHRTKISYTHQPDRQVIVVERILKTQEMMRIIEILKYNNNWDMIVYLICDYIVDAKLK